MTQREVSNEVALLRKVKELCEKDPSFIRVTDKTIARGGFATICKGYYEEENQKTVFQDGVVEEVPASGTEIEVISVAVKKVRTVFPKLAPVKSKASSKLLRLPSKAAISLSLQRKNSKVVSPTPTRKSSKNEMSRKSSKNEVISRKSMVELDENYNQTMSVEEVQQEMLAMQLCEKQDFVVKLLGSVEKPELNEYWLVMELCACSLSQFLAHELKDLNHDLATLSEDNRLKLFAKREKLLHLMSFILTPIAFALKELHGIGVIHRDVNEFNILMDRFGVPKLTDFGLSSISQDKSLDLNQVKLSAKVKEGSGTEYYTAPELVTQHPIKMFNAKADAWSFGVTAMSVYRRIHGLKIFPGSSWSDLKLFYHLYYNSSKDSEPQTNFYKRNGLIIGEETHQKEKMFIENFILPFLVFNQDERLSLQTWSQKKTRADLTSMWKDFASKGMPHHPPNQFFNLAILDIKKILKNDFFAS